MARPSSGVSAKNGVATVNLSTEYDSGSGSDSMQFRLAQVVYTLTQFSTIKSVVFQIDGVTVTVFGSEGIVLDGPVGRADYYDQLPAIFVDRPAFGAAFASGDRVAGNANVFEATFRVAVLDAGGKTLADEQVMATCGTGCRGTFSTTLALHGQQGPVGHAPRVRPVSQGRDTRERSRVSRLADARRLISSCGSRPISTGLSTRPGRPMADSRPERPRTTCRRRPRRSCRRPWHHRRSSRAGGR